MSHGADSEAPGGPLPTRAAAGRTAAYAVTSPTSVRGRSRGRTPVPQAATSDGPAVPSTKGQGPDPSVARRPGEARPQSDSEVPRTSDPGEGARKPESPWAASGRLDSRTGQGGDGRNSKRQLRTYGPARGRRQGSKARTRPSPWPSPTRSSPTRKYRGRLTPGKGPRSRQARVGIRPTRLTHEARWRPAVT